MATTTDETNTTIAQLYSRTEALRRVLRQPVPHRTPEDVAEAVATLYLLEYLENLIGHATDVSPYTLAYLRQLLTEGQPIPTA